MKRNLLVIILASITVIWISCSGGAKKREQEPQLELATVTEKQPETHGTEVKEVKLSNPLDAAMIKDGKGIFDLKCSACHKLTDEKLVGPGWKGVTKKRQPTWVINMITNVDMMLEKDAEAQKLLEQCLVRMPNQNITEKDARSILEFMRSNDGEK